MQLAYDVPHSVIGKRFATFKQTARQYPAFSESSLRWLRFNGGENGFNVCVRKIGRKVFLDLDAFERWIDEQGGATK